MPIPTIAVKESLDDLKGIGPSTGISGFKLVHVIGKGLYQWQTGDQSGNVGTDTWVSPSEDTSGKSGAWNRIERTGLDANVVSGTAGTNGNLGQWNADGDLVDSGLASVDLSASVTESDTLTFHEGHQQTVSANSYFTIFDISTATELISGSMYGRDTGFRLTIDSTVVANRTGPATGDDSGSAQISVATVPQAKADSNMKLELRNSSGASADFGWRIITR